MYYLFKNFSSNRQIYWIKMLFNNNYNNNNNENINNLSVFNKKILFFFSFSFSLLFVLNKENNI